MLFINPREAPIKASICPKSLELTRMIRIMAVMTTVDRRDSQNILKVSRR